MGKRSSYQLFFITLQFLTAVALGQKKAIKKPKAYRIPDGTAVTPFAPRVDLPFPSGAWIVYPDRDKITVRAKPDTVSERLGDLPFMKPCYVVGEQEHYLLVIPFEDSLILEDDGYIKNGKSSGWCRKSELLLWESCLIKKPYGLPRKIFPVMPQGVAIAKLCRPELEEQTGTGDSLRYFYIAKETADKYLVSTSEHFSQNGSSNILGWFPKVMFFEWNSNRGLLISRTDTSALKSLSILYPGLNIKTRASGKYRQHLFFPLEGKSFFISSPVCQKVGDSPGVVSGFAREKFPFVSGDGRINSYCGLRAEMSDTLILKYNSACILPIQQVVNMTDFFEEHLRNIDIKNSSLLQSEIKKLFGKLSAEFHLSTDGFLLDEFAGFFGKDLKIPFSMKGKRISDFNVKNIPEEDIRYFLDCIIKMLNSEDQQIEVDFQDAYGKRMSRFYKS